MDVKSDKSLHIKPYKNWSFHLPISQYDLLPYFQRVFMRDQIMTTFNKECGIYELDTCIGIGAHWTYWHKLKKYDASQKIGRLYQMWYVNNYLPSSKWKWCYLWSIVSLCSI